MKKFRGIFGSSERQYSQEKVEETEGGLSLVSNPCFLNSKKTGVLKDLYYTVGVIFVVLHQDAVRDVLDHPGGFNTFICITST